MPKEGQCIVPSFNPAKRFDKVCSPQRFGASASGVLQARAAFASKEMMLLKKFVAFKAYSVAT